MAFCVNIFYEIWRDIQTLDTVKPNKTAKKYELPDGNISSRDNNTVAVAMMVLALTIPAITL